MITIKMLRDYKDEEQNVELEKGEITDAHETCPILIGHLLFQGYAYIVGSDEECVLKSKELGQKLK